MCNEKAAPFDTRQEEIRDRENRARFEAYKAAYVTKFGDPWNDRPQGMRCKTCMWFVPKKASEQAAGMPFDIGRCRRHAPTMSGFPVVFVNDWCGDHRLDETKM